MSTPHKKYWSTVLWLLAYILIGVIIFYTLYNEPSTERSWQNFVAIIGSYSSVFGLFVMVVQFRSVRKTTEETKDKLDSVTLISDWSRAVELMRGIETDIKRDNIAVANYKLKTVKDIIIKSRSISTEKQTKDFENSIKKLNNYIDILNQYELDSSNPNKVINKNDILSGLERIVDVMSCEVSLSKNRL